MTVNIQQDTRSRLLESAMSLFADRGFEKTTLAAISDSAEANIAAVNYHFRDKQSLYLEALRAAYQEANAACPVLQSDPDDSPEACLRHHIHAMISQIFSPSEAGYFCRMVAKEFAEPTFAVDVIFSELLSQNRAQMHRSITGILGPDASEQSVHLAMISVVAQFQFFNFSRLIREMGGRSPLQLPDSDMIAEHIYQFSIAGLQGIKQRALQS